MQNKTLFKLMDVLSIVFITSNIILVILYYNNLPDKIITHYNILGEADAYGDKSSIIFLVITNILMYAIVSLVERKPQIWNFPTIVTDTNREKLYMYGSQLLKSLKLVFLFSFLYISYCNIVNKNIGLFFTILNIIVPSVLLFYYIFKMIKAK